jgi:predicted TIM-barrel fold metal-dependent hydrolase
VSDRPSILGAPQTRPTTKIPPGACDCHTHVFGPAGKYPFSPDRTYTPGDASIEDMLALHAILGVDRVVIVHPSPYGTDNSCTVDALRQIGDQARGVAVIDEATSDAALHDMHDAGMRGIRLNLHTFGDPDPATAWDRLTWAARRVAPLGWHVQIYTSLGLIAALSDRIPTLPTPLVIDHYGRAMAADGPQQPGFDKLLALLGTGRVYLKLSAQYRVSQQPGHADVGDIARPLIAANPDRLVWATDWPHPGGGTGGPRKRDEIEPFHQVDDGAALERLASWAGDAATLQRILVDNPARLYDFGPLPP